MTTYSQSDPKLSLPMFITTDIQPVIGSEISIRLPSGSRRWIDLILPVAPAHSTGPSTDRNSCARTLAMTCSRDKVAMKQRSSLTVSLPASSSHKQSPPGFIAALAALAVDAGSDTVRLDWLIPVSELHLRSILKEWMTHYNGARPHMALGPGVPDPPPAAVRPAAQPSGHQIGERLVLRVKSILGSLHLEYSDMPQLA